MFFLNTKYKLFFLILFFQIFSKAVSSQNLVFNSIKSINLFNQSVIKNGDDVKGYFFIYEKDTVDDYIDTYKFTITDKKLQLIKEIEIKVSEETSIFESSCNGSEIVLSFLKSDTKSFEYQIYDLTGLKKFTYTRKISRKAYKEYLEIILKGKDQNAVKSFYPVDSIGFIYNTMRNPKELNSISVDFYGTKENKQWKYEPIMEGSYFFWDYLGVFKNVVYIYIYSFKGSIYLDKPEVFIVGLDIKTGKELFKKAAESKYKIVAKEIKMLNDGAAYLYGTYFKQNANVSKDKADGFAMWKITEDGSLIDEKYISWENDLGKLLNVTNTGKVLGTGYVHVHNIVQSANGNMYLLGEGYNKVINGFTVAYGALYGILNVPWTWSYTKEVATDMMLLKLDAECKLIEITVYNKKNSDFFCYSGTQNNRPSNSFSFWYFSNKSNVVNAINVNDDKITTDKIRINLKTSRSTILPASAGQILLLEYYKTERKLELHFETALNE